MRYFRVHGIPFYVTYFLTDGPHLAVAASPMRLMTVRANCLSLMPSAVTAIAVTLGIYSSYLLTANKPNTSPCIYVVALLQLILLQP